MIQDPSKELTLIVYNTPNPPRYLKINKGLIRNLLIVIPFLIIIILSFTFLYSMVLKKKVNELRSSEPKIITDLKEQSEKLTNQIVILEKQNALLTQKLSLGPTKETTTSIFEFFTVPLGLEDLREKNLLKIENINLKAEGDRIKFSFNLANNTTNKLSGYLFIVQYQKDNIQIYPKDKLSDKNLKLEFSKGESFGFSRFRPTEANFSLLSKESSRYKIFIFSREGNLLSYRQVGPYNIE